MENEVMVTGANALEQRLKMANLLAESDVIPERFNGKAGNVLAVLQAGSEIGLKEMQSIKAFYVTKKNELSMMAETMLAIVVAQHDYAGKEERYDDATKTYYFTIKRRLKSGQIEDTTGKFSLQDAQNAQLLGKDNWKSYPERMLRSRAMSFACRGAFPDRLAGYYSLEEYDEMPDNKEPEKNNQPKQSEQTRQPENPDNYKKTVLPEAKEGQIVDVSIEAKREEAKFDKIARCHFTGRDEIVAEADKILSAGIKTESDLKKFQDVIKNALRRFVDSHKDSDTVKELVKFAYAHLDVDVVDFLCGRLNKTVKHMFDEIPMDVIKREVDKVAKKLSKIIPEEQVKDLLAVGEKNESREGWFEIYQNMKNTLRKKGGK